MNTGAEPWSGDPPAECVSLSAVNQNEAQAGMDAPWMPQESFCFHVLPEMSFTLSGVAAESRTANEDYKIQPLEKPVTLTNFC